MISGYKSLVNKSSLITSLIILSVVCAQNWERKIEIAEMVQHLVLRKLHFSSAVIVLIVTVTKFELFRREQLERGGNLPLWDSGVDLWFMCLSCAALVSSHTNSDGYV